MGIGTYGFIKGFTGDVRDSIDKREESERDRKKSIFLEGLRRDTAKWQKELDESYSLKDPDKNQEEIDYVKGVKVLKNKRGETLREVPLTQSDREQYDLETRGKKANLSSLETKAKYAEQEALLGLDRDRAAIDASRASADNSRSGSSLNRAQSKALDGSSTTGEIGSFEAGRELVSEYKGLDSQLAAEGFPREWTENLAAASVARAKAESIKSGGKINVDERSRQIFLRAVQNERQKKTKAGLVATEPKLNPTM